MKNLTIFLCFMLLPFLALSQNEIDKLVEKYGENQFAIYTTSGELQVKSKILKHGEVPPYSIILYGEIEIEDELDMFTGGGESCDIVASFLLDVILQKKSDGYKLTNDKTGMFQYNMNKDFICSSSSFHVEFEKSNFLFKANREFVKPPSKWIENKNLPIGGYFQEQSPLIKFSIEMIDKKRLGPKEAQPFRF